MRAAAECATNSMNENEAKTENHNLTHKEISGMFWGNHTGFYPPNLPAISKGDREPAQRDEITSTINQIKTVANSKREETSPIQMQIKDEPDFQS